MSYQEKRTIASLVSGILVLVAYGIFALGKLQSETYDPANLKFWAITMLIFIGIGIVATIIIQIVFHILMAISIAIKEKESDEAVITKTIEASFVEDEMDKLIELKASRIGFAFAGFGFVIGLVLLAFDGTPSLMLNILFLSYSIGSLCEGFGSLYYYRKGIKNG
jgi:uncharacterized membrane protein